jgi:very-short-patch-repair endonuclease
MRTMVEPDFVVCHRGNWGILEIDGSSHEGRKAHDTEKDRLYHAHSISVVRRYTEEQAREHPEVIVAEFLRDIENLG